MDLPSHKKDFHQPRFIRATAGMAVALDILTAVEALGGRPMPADISNLVVGAVTEQSVPAAVELGSRLPLLQNQGFDNSYIAGLYQQLASMCLDLSAPEQADECLEVAEKSGIPIKPELIDRLMKALGGRPRRAALSARKSKLLEKVVGDQLDIEEGVEEDEERENVENVTPGGVVEAEVSYLVVCNVTSTCFW